MLPYTITSGLRDNHHRGTVGGFLADHIHMGSRLSVVSAYFTIYAFQALQNELNGIHSLRFLFGEPRFSRSLDPDKTDKKSFQIEDTGLTLDRRLEQRRTARDCAEWIKDKVEIRSVTQSNLLHGKMYHLAHAGIEKAILGSSNFTVSGLHCAGNQSARGNVELQLAESQIALELLTCVAFLEENSLMSEKAFEGLDAADKVRVLLFWLGVPAAVPDRYAALKARETGADAPKAVTEIRNAIIHPTNSNGAKREKIDMNAVYEAWQLNLWYVELALLKLIGYSGPYSNRTTREITGASELTPWTPKAN